MCAAGVVASASGGPPLGLTWMALTSSVRAAASRLPSSDVKE
jgi:hypothetical protein